jgi:hypothetical protein
MPDFDYFGVDSAGEIVADEQVARDDGANTQSPEIVAGRITQGFSNADGFRRDEDVGTNDELRSAEETQATPPNTANNPIPSPSDLPGPGSAAPTESDVINDPVPGQNPGVASPNDDQSRGDNQTASTTNDVQTRVNSTFGNTAIVPRPNILDRCSSSTYSVSIYLMSPEQYRRMLETKQRYLAGYQLLMQSAGIPMSSGIQVDDFGDTEPGGVSITQGRNQYFPLDFYLDDLEIKSVINGKGSGGAHNAVEMRFKIIEPNGITLLDNLYSAAQQYNTAGGGASRSIINNNYAAQNYLMVVRFYGYDANGKLITNAGLTDSAGKTDSNAILEKFIPFQFTSIKFAIKNKLTEYECIATCPQYVIGTSQGRGVIPYNIELTGTTLSNLFNGNMTGTTTSPANANAAANPTLATGLAQALNKYQAELVTEGTYDIADRYSFEIVGPELQQATITPPGATNLKMVPMTQATTAAQAADGNKQSVNTIAKNVSAVAGTSIVQFVDLAVRSSSYITKQQTKIIDKDGEEIPQAGGAKQFAWYRIGVEAKPIGSRPDPKRNDFAYNIKYQISMYGVNDIKSTYFPRGKFRGTQKRYSYWFTGQNTSILNFEQDFNYLFYITVNSRQNRPRSTGNYREVEKRIFSPNSGQTNQGSEGNVYEPGANAADYLYSPGDQSRVKLTIVGDPAWIQQGEVWSGVAGANQDLSPFLDDGTINFESQEALFEVDFNKPADYNLQTGLLDPGQKNYGANRVTGVAGEATQTYIYKAISVTSNFRQGRFTQDLEGVMITFPIQDGPIVSGPKPPVIENGEQVDVPDQSDAETQRLLRSGTASNQSRESQGTFGDPYSENYSEFSNTTGGTVEYSPSVTQDLTQTSADLGSQELLEEDTQPMFYTQPRAPTSFGEVVGPAGQPAQTAFASENFTVPVVTVTTTQGSVVPVTTPQQANALYLQGYISENEQNRVITSLQAQTSAEQSETSLYSQMVRKDA